MNYFTYNRMLHNSMGYKDLERIDQIELRKYALAGKPLHLVYLERDELSAEPINIGSNILLHDFADWVYRIKPDTSLVDYIAYPIWCDVNGFYRVRTAQHKITEALGYLEYLNHKDFIGVLYKGAYDITYATSIGHVYANVPEYLYMRYSC